MSRGHACIGERDLHPFDSGLDDQVMIARQFDLDPSTQAIRPVADHLEAKGTQLLMECRLAQRVQQCRGNTLDDIRRRS
jgi:hypothetical protein